MDLKHHAIELKSHWDIDHLCYRVDTETAYETTKQQFSAFGQLLIESEVNGRLISTFQLNQSIVFKDWCIDLVELPAPKKGKSTPPGFEHIEVVVDVPFAELEEKYKHLNLDRGGLKKPFNQELEIVLGARNIKFHQMSLASVIKLESNQRVSSTLQESAILQDFKSFRPLLAGTFALGVDTETSDLDILMTAEDLAMLQDTISARWNSAPDFKSQMTRIDGMNSLLINFSFNGVPFEIFAQTTESVRQKAYRHFLAEERLLKAGGKDFLLKVINIRKKEKLKTEPALTKALGISTDPYETLLEIQTQSYTKIKELFRSLE